MINGAFRDSVNPSNIYWWHSSASVYLSMDEPTLAATFRRLPSPLLFRSAHQGRLDLSLFEVADVVVYRCDFLITELVAAPIPCYHVAVETGTGGRYAYQ